MRPGMPRPFGLAPKCGARFVARLAHGSTIGFAALRAIIRISGPTQMRFILLGTLRRLARRAPVRKVDDHRAHPAARHAAAPGQRLGADGMRQRTAENLFGCALRR